MDEGESPPGSGGYFVMVVVDVTSTTTKLCDDDDDDDVGTELSEPNCATTSSTSRPSRCRTWLTLRL